MKILVIGNGFIGASIIQRLESDGHELLIFSRTFKVGSQSQQLIGNIFDFDTFKETLSWRPEVIIHTAWVTAHGLYTHDSSNHQYAQFTSDLARSVRHTHVSHLIILGTCAEYGSQSMASTAGLTKLNPDSLYALQKVAALKSVKESLLGSNTRLTWARIFQPYGLNQDKKRLVPYLIDSLKNGKSVELKDTSSVHDWITTRDIASAISWVINHDTPEEVDVGTSIGYTNVELFRHLESLLGHSNNWTRIPLQPTETQRIILAGKDSALFTSGWAPSDGLNSGLEWTLNE
jgi:nucleoside-diphosphate-sugar epimerase